jgi:hypothetical protein
MVHGDLTTSNMILRRSDSNSDGGGDGDGGGGTGSASLAALTQTNRMHDRIAPASAALAVGSEHTIAAQPSSNISDAVSADSTRLPEAYRAGAAASNQSGAATAPTSEGAAASSRPAITTLPRVVLAIAFAFVAFFTVYSIAGTH